jgi:hypothetical protein
MNSTNNDNDRYYWAELSKYRKWKRENVTLRGMKNVGEENGVFGSFGRGLYTCALSNRTMARQYGKVYFVVNGRPRNPKKFQSLNNFEIFRQRYENIEIMVKDIMVRYDGIEIPGREMVNYSPENVLYFESEIELMNYFENLYN